MSADPSRACATCALTERRDRGEAPPWDLILRTRHWDLAHAFGTAIEGWLVLVLRRHAATLAELSDDEATDVGLLVQRASQALRDAVDAEKTYVAQFAEHPDHRHVHIHVIARREDLGDGWRGPGVFGAMGVEPDRLVPEWRMTEIAAAVRRALDGQVPRLLLVE